MARIKSSAVKAAREAVLALSDARSAMREAKKGLDIDACWATWSVPFDQEEDFAFIATAYYLSPAVRTYCRLAVGRDYLDAAPVRGVRQGGGGESMEASVLVAESAQQ